MKRIISLLLLAAMLISAAACADNSTDDSELTSAQIDEETAEDETLSPAKEIGIPDGLTYDGEKFNIYSYEHSAYKMEHLADEEKKGDLVNDAVLNRNGAVMDLLNIKVTAEIFPWDNDIFRQNIHSSIMAGDEEYDMITGNSYNMTALTAEGMFMNISKVEPINIAQPWWNTEAIEELSVGDRTYMLYGDISMSNYGRYQCYFFNKDYIRDYHFDDPYDVFAKDGWNLDYFISATKDFYVDVDGNDTVDETDIFGEYSPLQSVYDISNNWVIITEKDDENYPQVTFYSERTQIMFDKLRQYFVESPGVLAPMGWTDWELFANGNSVFMYSVLNDSTKMRDMKSDYGILPIPKYDENQEKYETVMGGTLVSVPKTASDPERTGYVMETLAYYGRKLVYPAYVDTAIMIKGTRDDEAGHAIETILNSGHSNFGVAFSGFSGYGYGLLEYCKTQAGFASWIAKYERNATKELNDYADHILALED